MALGIARNGQTAGWGTGAPRARMVSTARMGYTVYDTPVFSFLRNTTDRNGSIQPGTYDLTGLGSISGYNNARLTMLTNLYLPWSAGLPDNFYGSPISGEAVIAGAGPYYFNIYQGIGGGSLYIGVSLPGTGNQMTLPGAYTAYTNQWLTLVFSSSETSSSYTAWTGTGSGTNAVRIAVYNSVTGALIRKQDFFVTPSVNPPWNTLPATTTNTQTSGSDYLFFQTFGGAGQEFRQTQLATWVGSMWDPLSQTNTSFTTTRPTPTLGNSGAGTAVINLVYSDYAYDGSALYTNTEHFGDLLVPTTSTEVFKLTNGGTTPFTTGYSTAIYPTSQGTG
jgi:hypothetical protein